MLENEYQSQLITKIKRLLPGCLVIKNDPNYLQGIPDLTIFYGPLWAFLEVKKSANARESPNQRHYIERWSESTFCAFIYPENEEEVLGALQQSLAG